MKIRDAGTGLYISQEEADTKPTNTWVTEKDAPKSDILEVYKELEARAIWDGSIVHVPDTIPGPTDETRYITVAVVKEVLRKHGFEDKI